MAEVVVFHHAQGLTRGVLAFATSLREAGHVVHTPDLYEGETFTDLGSGVAHAEAIGFDVLVDRGSTAVADLTHDLVYAGFSLGVLPAQKLAQTRPGARGALLYHGAVPASEFGTGWPEGVPVQIHLMANDEWGKEDIEAAEALRAEADAEVFVYPGASHLFADSTLPDFDSSAAALLVQRTLAFLSSLG